MVSINSQRRHSDHRISASGKMLAIKLTIGAIEISQTTKSIEACEALRSKFTRLTFSGAAVPETF
ncbi:MAG: hypothetical protein ACFCA4_09635 [Cyanophyceae cyanobacterium]